jgi:ABC-type multidrug transport system ATPase subunit
VTFTLHNNSDRTLSTNFYDWRLHKHVDGEWYSVAPRFVNQPLMTVEPGDTHAWELAVDNDGVEEGQPVRPVSSIEDIDLTGVGGGQYAFRARGWFEEQDHETNTVFAATFEFEGEPLSLTPSNAIEGVGWDEETLVAESNRGKPDNEDYRLGAYELERVESAEGARTMITEQVLRRAQLRDVVALALEHDADSVRLEEHNATHPIFGIDEARTVTYAGETLALVGPTGAGKSTVLKLLPRLYDVDGGSVRIDGQDVRRVGPGSLRESIGYVGQETFLFFGSVADNIRYGSFDASREDVIEAAKAAQAHEFIQDLEDGYDTEVGERGVKLSGGQRQRISIARVLLQDPDILILDEATSDVDTETELRIQEQLDALAADRTVLAIAHRLSTIKDADEILVLEDGSVVERGTHDELVGENGLYAKLWGVQAGQIEDAMPERQSELTHP